MASRTYGLLFRHPSQTMPKSAYRVAHSRTNPPKIDLAEPALPSPFEPSLDQQPLGACGANALAEGIVFDELESGEEDVVLPSRLFLYWIARWKMGRVREDSGVINSLMMEALSEYGFCDEELCPYNIRDFRRRPSRTAFSQAMKRLPIDYSVVPQDIDDIRSCLADRKPFLFGFQVYQSFESDQVEKTGIVPYPSNTEKLLGGHDVLAVGYDDVSGYIKFKNSYGPDWGDKGYGYIPYEYAIEPALSGDYWTVDHAGRP